MGSGLVSRGVARATVVGGGAVVAFVVGAATLSAQAFRPEIRSSSPEAFFVGADGVTILLVEGRLVPDDVTGHDVVRRVRVLLQRGGRRAPVMLSGWRPDRLKAEFVADGWMSRVGELEAVVVVDGVESEPHRIPVNPLPVGAPVLLDVLPSRVVPSDEPHDFANLVRVSGLSFADADRTGVTIGGTRASIGLIRWNRASAGVIDVWLPKNVRERPGTYDVQVGVDGKLSNVKQIVVAPEVTIDARAGTIRFGDGEHGRIPSASSKDGSSGEAGRVAVSSAARPGPVAPERLRAVAALLRLPPAALASPAGAEGPLTVHPSELEGLMPVPRPRIVPVGPRPLRRDPPR